MVAERSISLWRFFVRKTGDIRSEDADISNVKKCENHFRRKSKNSYPTEIVVGLVGP